MKLEFKLFLVGMLAVLLTGWACESVLPSQPNISQRFVSEAGEYLQGSGTHVRIVRDTKNNKCVLVISYTGTAVIPWDCTTPEQTR